MRALLLLLAAAPVCAQIAPGARLRFYARETFGPGMPLRAAFGAGYAQLFDSPPEWGRGGAGFGRRMASRAGQSIVQNSIELGAGLALGEDPRYRRKGEGPAPRRAWYAASSILVWRTEGGAARPALARLGGIYGGGMISMAWHPDRFRATGDGVRAANLRVGTAAALNVVREFWPDIRRLFRRRPRPGPRA